MSDAQSDGMEGTEVYSFPNMKSNIHYRTEIFICVGCKKEIKSRFRVERRWAGYFRMAQGARWCPRCSTVKKLADEGDSFCKLWVNNHLAAYA